MTLRIQRRGDVALAIGIGVTAQYAFKIHVPRVQGDEVLAGRQINLAISDTQAATMRVFYSPDGGATFFDRGTADVIAAGVPFFTTLPAIGTDMRIEILQGATAGVLTSILHLV